MSMTIEVVYENGVLKPTDMVWKDGMARWIRASSLTELFPDPASSLDQFFSNPKEPAAAQPAPVPAGARRRSIRDSPSSRRREGAASELDVRLLGIFRGSDDRGGTTMLFLQQVTDGWTRQAFTTHDAIDLVRIERLVFEQRLRRRKLARFRNNLRFEPPTFTVAD